MPQVMSDHKTAAPADTPDRSFSLRSRVSNLRESDPEPLLGISRGRVSALQRKKEVDPIAESLLQGAGANIETKPHITRPNEENSWVHSAAKVKCTAAASVPFEVWRGDPRVDKQAKRLPPDDPIAVLFRSPIPNQTGSQFTYQGCQHRIFDGEDFWFLLDASGRPISVPRGGKIPVPAHILSVRGRWVGLETDASTGWPARWRASMNGTRGDMTADANSVIQFLDYNLDDPLRGLGDVETLQLTLELGWQASRYELSVLRNSGDPGGFITTETPLAPEEITALEDEAKQIFGVQNAGRWKVLSGKDTKYAPNKLGPRDMEFKSMKPWNRDEILGAMGVPPPLVAAMENATLANLEQSAKLLWRGGNGVLVYLSSVETVATERFLQRLDRPDAKQLFGRFDLSRVKELQTDYSAQIQLAANVRSPLNLSTNEALKLVRVDVDADAIEHGDEHLVPAGQTTVDRLLENAKNPPEVDPNPAGSGDAPKDDSADNEDNADKAVDPVVTRSEEPAAAPDPEVAKAAARRSYWAKRETAVLIPGEAAMRSAYRAFRKPYEREQFKRIRDFAEDGDEGLRATKASTDQPADDGFSKPGNDPSEVEKLMLPRERQVQRMIDRIQPAVISVAANSLEDLAQDMNIEFPLTGSSPEVLAAMRAQTIRLAEGHTSALADRVRQSLLDSLAKATSTGTLQERVREVLDDMQADLHGVFSDRQTRANVIARDQTSAASNTARFMQMRHVGTKRHTWVSSHDSAVRGAPGGPYEDAEYSHFELDGKTVDIGLLFDAANHPHLKFPHDPDGAPGDVIECRCVAQPEVNDPDDEDEQ